MGVTGYTGDERTRVVQLPFQEVTELPSLGTVQKEGFPEGIGAPLT